MTVNRNYAKLLSSEIQDIALKNLSVIWIQAQRPFDKRHAENIAKDFDPDKFDPILVTKPNGEGVYHIVEGQHRKAAAEVYVNHDTNQKVRCRVVEEADPARAAELFLGINGGRKAIRPVAEFLVALTAERPVEVAVHNIVKRNGWRIADGKGDNCLCAVGTVKMVYSKYGPTVLRDTLETCRALWGSDSRGVSGEILKGMSLFLNEFNPYIVHSHLIKAVTSQYRSPGNFISAAQVMKEKSSETLEVAMAELLIAKYNKGLRLGGKKLIRKT